MNIDQLIMKLRSVATDDDLQETEETSLLHLEKNAFVTKMLKEPDGQQLLDLLQSGEWKICERMGLCNGYIQNDVAYIDVPGWKNLLAHLRIVNSVGD
jgi:hypothetical protein